MARIGIVGFGRIGRNLFRLLYRREDIQIGAVSDPADPAAIEYLLRFDTLLGRFPDELSITDGHIEVAGRKIPVFSGAQADSAPWGELGVDTVLEATSHSRTRAQLERHLEAGAKRVILLAPPADRLDMLVVGALNDGELRPEDRIVSNATSTVHCIAPVLAILHERFGVRRALFLTVHSYTGQHRLADVPSPDPRLGRAAAENIIPQESRSPRMLEDVLPSLAGRITGTALSVPVSRGSAVDLDCWLERPADAAAINAAARAAAASDRWKNVLCYETNPIVSSDVLRSRYSCTFDSLATMTVGDRLAKVVLWYDAGYGYAHRAIELVERFAAMEAAP